MYKVLEAWEEKLKGQIGWVKKKSGREIQGEKSKGQQK